MFVYPVSQDPEFEFRFGHVVALKLLGRVCNSFKSHKTRVIGLYNCKHRWYQILKKN